MTESTCLVDASKLDFNLKLDDYVKIDRIVWNKPVENYSHHLMLARDDSSCREFIICLKAPQDRQHVLINNKGTIKVK